MKILFTGTSSFTGYWFIQELLQSGHVVQAICQKSPTQYESVRQMRIKRLETLCDLKFNCPFGSDSFFDLILSESFDLFCHHAAETSDYKSPTFNYIEALQQNTSHLESILKILQEKGCNRILLTGSMFENNEGGTADSKAVSLYGLSKGLTYEVFKYFAQTYKMKLGKFVISNPFGPYEDRRFTCYLIESWKNKITPVVNTPSYVRDNIHVDLLAMNYRIFAEQMNPRAGLNFCRPSGYIETQAKFAQRVAQEMSRRLSVECPIELKKQADFSEPVARFNTESPEKTNWDESVAWDRLATYYQNVRSSV